MSVYYDAVSVLTDRSSHGGSFISRIYNAQNLKSPPTRISALIFECAKYDIVLKEVIENAGILPLEPKVCLIRPIGYLGGSMFAIIPTNSYFNPSWRC